MPSTCLIIPVFNGGAAFAECLRSVAALDPPPDEIIVVDDGSTDGSAALARSFGHRVISLPAPGGPARARNRGADQTRADILLFLDADVSAPSDHVGAALGIFENSPELAAIIGSYDDAPGQPGFLSQYRNLLHHYVHQTSSRDAKTFWGACGAIRREAFWALGGFDEPLRYLEDVDLGLRLSKAGYQLRLAKQWQVKHWKGYTVRSLIHTDVVQRALPWTRLALRRHGLISDLNTKPGHRLSVGLSFLLPLLLAAGFFAPWFWIGFILAICAFIMINKNFYAYLARRKNIGFAILAVFWHWVHYVSSGIGLGMGLLKYH